MPKVLAKHQEFFLDLRTVVLKDHNVVDALLQLFLVFLFKSIDIKYKKMAIVAADPREVVVHTAAE